MPIALRLWLPLPLLLLVGGEGSIALCAADAGPVTNPQASPIERMSRYTRAPGWLNLSTYDDLLDHLAGPSPRLAKDLRRDVLSAHVAVVGLLYPSVEGRAVHGDI